MNPTEPTPTASAVVSSNFSVDRAFAETDRGPPATRATAQVLNAGPLAGLEPRPNHPLAVNVPRARAAKPSEWVPTLSNEPAGHVDLRQAGVPGRNKPEANLEEPRAEHATDPRH